MSDARPLVVLVTSSAPFGNEGAFAQAEISEMYRRGARTLVVPFRRPHDRANDDARASGLDAVCEAIPLLAPAVWLAALAELVRNPRAVLRVVWRVLRRSHGRRNLAVNALALPKALWLAAIVRRRGASHIHAYWLSHTTTAAMVASELTGVPYSGSGYRWDIDVDNLLADKFATATFLRCADEVGEACLREHPGAVAGKIVRIRTGVSLAPWDAVQRVPCQPAVWCCPGAFVEKKAHVLLVQALAKVRADRPEVRLELFGEGPLEARIREEVARLGQHEAVSFLGYVPLEQLQRHLRDTRPVCVLPSIRTEGGEMEGIPVSLVEGMANGAPIVSTPTGSIEHLVRPGTGILVTPGDADALAAGLRRLLDEPGLAESLAAAARERVRDEFDLAVTSARLYEQFGVGPLPGPGEEP